MQTLNIFELPEEDAEYWEYTILELPSKLKITKFTRGTWRFLDRGLIRKILLGAMQEPHPGDYNKETFWDKVVPIIGFTSHPKPAWVKCPFDRPFKKILTLVGTVVGEYKTDIPNIIVGLPIITIDLPEIPDIPIYCHGCEEDNCKYGWFSFKREYTCPKCGSGNVTLFTGNDRFEQVMRYRAMHSWRQRLHDWWILNPLRNLIANTLTWLQYDLFGLSGAFMPVNLTAAYVEEIRNAINQLVDNIEKGINNLIEDLEKKIVKATSDAINNFLLAYGLFRNLAQVPVIIKDITGTGFTWLCNKPNMTVSIFGLGIP